MPRVTAPALERNREEARRAGREGRWSLSARRHACVEPTLERIALERALAELPAEYRSVLVLRELHGLSHREIAAQLGISENLSGVGLSRARRAAAEHPVASRAAGSAFRRSGSRLVRDLRAPKFAWLTREAVWDLRT